MKALVVIFMCLGGNFLFAQSVSALQDSVFQHVKVLPNPTSEILFLKNVEEMTAYRLIDMSGKEVQKGKTNCNVISLIDEQVGTYFLILEIKGIEKSFLVRKY